MNIISRVMRKVCSIYREKEEFISGNKIIENSQFSTPNFLIIGAPKAGTTSLFQYLAKHQHIIPSQKKELLYFSVNQRMGLRGYLKNFPLKQEKMNKLTFEASPSYLFYPNGLQRIKRLFPGIKLVVLLRDPVNRAFSQWNFNQ